MTAIDVEEGGAMVEETHQIDRGCECVEEKVSQCGARLHRVPA